MQSSRRQRKRVPPHGRHRERKLTRGQVILCFDGTGNKFSGTERRFFSWWDRILIYLGTSADSNILKIYGMLDHDNGDSMNLLIPVSQQPLTSMQNTTIRCNKALPISDQQGFTLNLYASQELVLMLIPCRYPTRVGWLGSTPGTRKPKIPL